MSEGLFLSSREFNLSTENQSGQMDVFRGKPILTYIISGKISDNDLHIHRNISLSNDSKFKHITKLYSLK